MTMEATARTLISTWLAGFTWTTAPTIVVEAQEGTDAAAGATEEGDAMPALPTLSLEMPTAQTLPLTPAKPREDSPTDIIVWELGRFEAATAQFVFRCRSKAEAEQLLEDWRREVTRSMLEDGEARMPISKQLNGTFLGVTDHVRVFLRPDTAIYQPLTAESLPADLWILRADALISYPYLEAEAGPGTGRIESISLEHHRC